MYVRGLADRGALDVTVEISRDFGRLPSDVELMLLRLIQESLTNVIRYSGSKTAAIRMIGDSDNVKLEVRASGRGFPEVQISDTRSLNTGVGIRGMRERVRQFQGQMKIKSMSQGTKVTVSLPIPAQTQKADTAARLRGCVFLSVEFSDLAVIRC